MEKFSLDRVRDSFSSDVRSMLDRAEQAGSTMLKSPVLSTPLILTEDDMPIFERLGHHFHAIYGTSALLDVKSLSESARLLEEVAEAGDECLKDLDRQIRRTRAFAEICNDGVGALRQMLELELDKQGDKAQEIAERLVERTAQREEMAAEKTKKGKKKGRKEREKEREERLEAAPAEPPSPPAPPPAEAAPPAEAPPPAEGPAEPAFSFESPAEAEAPTAFIPPTEPKTEPAGPEMVLPPGPEEAAKIEFSFEHDAEQPAPPAEVDESKPPTQEFSFDETKAEAPAAPEEPAAPPPMEEIQQELLEVFQQEARESLVALQGYLQTLLESPGDAPAAKSLERIYHTLKGTSATVGLMSLSKKAAALQETMERVVDKAESVTPEFLRKLIDETNELLKSGGLPEISIGEPAPKPSPEQERSDELRRIFNEEAEEICRQAESLLRQIADVKVDRDVRASARNELGGLFHRLKGSAVINGVQEVADEAARLQELSQSPADEDPLGRDLESGLQKLYSMLGLKPGAAPAAAAKPATEGEAEPKPAGAPRGKEQFAPLRESVDIRIEPALWEAFEIESSELLDAIQKSVFALEESTQPKSVIADLFRTFHTLKGAANTTGLAPVGKLVHMVEDFLEELTEAAILPPMKSLTGFLLKVMEGLRKNLREARRGYVETNLKQLEVDLARMRSGKEQPAGTETAGETGTGTQHPSTITEGTGTGSKPATSKGTDSGERGAEAAEAKWIRVSTERLDGLMNLAGELVVSRSRLGRRVQALKSMERDLLASRGQLLGMVEGFRERYEFSLEQRKREAAMAGKAIMSVATPSRRAVVMGGDGGGEAGLRKAELFTDLEMDKYEDVNILARSLREVSDDISELQKQIVGTIEGFSEDSDAFSALITNLQDEITRARMVPVDQLFMRLRLPIRDAGEREKKEVRVVTAGEEVNLDKTIIDSLYLPMLHLVRNSVSHGIEAPSRRASAGKDRMGTITLSARQVSGQIVLEVSDDGGGLDLESIRSKGVSMGLIQPDVSADSPIVRDLIFVSGLSTRQTAGDVAGRGMGLGIVRREVEKLNGAIRVSAERNRGTTFIITLPLTLAITRALMVRNEGRLYAVPLHFAQRILDLATCTFMESAEVQRIRVDEEYLTLHSLSGILKLPGQSVDPTKGSALLLRVGDDRAVVRVDAVVGQEEIVVKSMGDLLVGHPLFSGVTISGDGHLILIVDVPGLLESTRREIVAPAAPVEVPSAPMPEGAAPRPAVAAPAAPEEEEEEFEARPARVLFVDDSLSVRKVAEKFLQASGADIVLAVDGVDALGKLRQGNFDLIFTDLEMPRMHGYEFIRELRYLPQFKEIPVVVVTSRSGAKHRTQAQLVGATDYVTKPFTQAILQEKLDRFVRRRRR